MVYDPGVGPVRWPTVGRDAELSTLVDAIGSARAGAGRLVVVEGVAGAGKSHLLDRLLTSITDPIAIARAQVPVGDLGTPFAAPLAALGLTLADVGVDPRGPRSLIEAGAGEVALAVVVDGLLRTVEDRCLDAPLLLVVDDVHAADLGTLMWLDRLAASVGSLPLAVVLAARPASPGTPFEQFRLSCAVRHDSVQLAPLDEAAVDALVTAVHGSPPGPLLARALGRTQGLPLFVTAILERIAVGDLVRIGDRVDVVDGDDLDLDGRAPDAVAERIRAVPPEMRRVLLAAAVLGERITAGHVHDMLEVPLVEVIELLDAAERAGLVLIDGVGYRFRHELYRQAVLDGVARPALAALHASAAHVRAARAEPAVVVARHLLAAEASGPEMAEWLVDAAESVVAYEPQNALMMVDLASSGVVAPSRRAIAVRGRALASVGRVAEAESVLRHLLATAPTHDEELQLRRELALALFQQGRPAESMVEMVRVVELAPDAAGRARARAEEAFTHLLVGGFAEAGEVAAEAQATGILLGDMTTEVAAAMVLCLVRLYHGEMSAALELADRLEHLTGLEATSDAAVYQPWFAAAMARVEADDHGGARRVAAFGQQRCIEAGYHWMVPGYDAVASYCSMRAGELSDSIAEATAALDWRITDRLGVAVWCHAFIARASVHQGELDRAAAALGAADQLIDQGRAQLGWDHVGLARAALAERRGDLVAAHDALADVWDLHLALGVLSAVQETGPELVRFESLIGRRERSATVLEVLDRAAERIGDPTRLADRERAHAWMQRDVDRLESAVAHARRSPRRLVAATALAELAAWHADLGSGRASLDAAAAAAELFSACGAVGDVRRLEPLLSRSSVRAETAVAGPSSLSRTETRVVRLVAEGLANAEIAARLHVSRRTVESHVSSAYRKLGVSNRVEMARVGLGMVSDHVA